MPFALAGAAVTAGAGLIGAGMQSSTAAKGQEQAQQQLQQQRADLAPYRDAGVPALNQESNLLGLNGPDAANTAMTTFQQSPGYQWQLQQGLRATDAGAAANGLLRSGATLKAEQTFGSGLADSDFNQYFSRLSGLSTLGANAAAGGAQTAGQAATADLGGANAQSSIYGNTATGLAGTANTLLNNPSFQNLIKGPTPQQMTGFAPPMQPGQVGVGGFVAPVGTY